MTEFLTLGPVAVTLIMALTQIVKELGVPHKWLPFLNVLMGIGGAFVFVDGDLKTVAISGIIAGLTACGTFDIGKSFFEEK